MNGSSGGVDATLADVPPIDWDAVLSNVNTSSSVNIYIGTDLNRTFAGIMDEVRTGAHAQCSVIKQCALNE